ncbi:MAG: hypothetical protein M3O30_17560 [Planctomycetota bacterium]|nr:hypothetical protein [Planctomycetota bacterium]
MTRTPISRENLRGGSPLAVKPSSISAVVQREIAAGRHSASFLTICSRCDQWVESIFYTVPNNRTRLCPSCADGIGQGPLSLAARRVAPRIVQANATAPVTAGKEEVQ